MSCSGVLRVLLGTALTLVFLMAGAVKLTPEINPEVHAEIAHEFETKYADIWLTQRIGFSHVDFRMAVGAVEVALALLLWITPRFSALLLMSIMGAAIYSHIVAHDPVEKVGMPSALLVLLLVFIALSGKKKTAAKQKTT
eukprot:m.26143 g.26143  ORF g.26143 m.26143 type:complete len:140 (+) comp9981_c1_seq1:280-699(+)